MHIQVRHPLGQKLTLSFLNIVKWIKIGSLKKAYRLSTLSKTLCLYHCYRTQCNYVKIFVCFMLVPSTLKSTFLAFVIHTLDLLWMFLQCENLPILYPYSLQTQERSCSQQSLLWLFPFTWKPQLMPDLIPSPWKHQKCVLKSQRPSLTSCSSELQTPPIDHWWGSLRRSGSQSSGTPGRGQNPSGRCILQRSYHQKGKQLE